MRRLIPLALGIAACLSVLAADWTALNAQARAEALTPIRPGVPGTTPFWNTNAWAFIHAPAIAFDAVAGAASYRITVTEEAGGIAHAFTAAQPWTPLTNVWDALPCGSSP